MTDAAMPPADAAAFAAGYLLRGQHTGDRALTRYRHDLPKMVENNEITTGPGRYRLGVPNAYGNAAFVPDPTIRMQRWGASHDMSSTKTDVESDLWNIGRPTVRSACGQYAPEQGAAVAARLTAMPETDFPMVHARLVDPPCTLRASGWNRWEWLCQDPQANVMMPFEWGVDSRHAVKDDYLDQLRLPLERSPAAMAHAGICGRVYMDPAVPVARPGGKASTNVIEGLPARAPTGAPTQSQPAYPAEAAQVSDRYVDKVRATTGVLAPPPPFTAFIAPH
jgi:hypothetical protein